MNARKRSALNRRTALSPRNILEYEAAECARLRDRNRSLKINSLATRSSDWVGRVVIVNPKEAEA
jgi:hypothetical protein